MSKTKNNAMISSLFHERSKFIVIGLTGRTGSGCTTAANILENETANFPQVEDPVCQPNAEPADFEIT